jgi:uncharacterized membrane protein YccC
VTIVASVAFYGFGDLLGDRTVALYGLFSAVAAGFLAQNPGPPRRQSLTLLRALPVAMLLVTAGTLLARNAWVASAGVLVVGFLIAFSRAGGPSLNGVAPGLQLFFILSCFPPYAPKALGSRLIGVLVGVGLVAVAERTLWPGTGPVSYDQRLADAIDRLAGSLHARASGRVVPVDALDWPAEAGWPAGLGPADRPTSAGRRDRALKDAGRALSFALARLRELPPRQGAAATQPLRCAADTARAAATALRGGRPPPSNDLGQAIAAVRSGKPQPDEATATLDAVWAMTIAIRIALGAEVEYGARPPQTRLERFPYADRRQIGLWRQRFAVHLTPRSVYFQGAVRVAVALAAARFVAGKLDLSHGFWVLLATLTLLRGRAATTGRTLGPAAIGTVLGAGVAAALLVVIGRRPGVYAAITPPTMAIAIVAGALFGLAWGQALFTVLVALIFSQLAPAGIQIAEVRVVDVFVGALIGVTAGALAWPRGAVGALRRSAAHLLVVSGELTRDTIDVFSGSGTTCGSGLARLRDATDLTEAAYAVYQLEQRPAGEPPTNWSAVLSVADHVARGADVLIDTRDPGSAAPWRAVVDDWTDAVGDRCQNVADAVRVRRTPPPVSTVVQPVPDPEVADVHLWLAGVTSDLARVGTSRPGS